MTDEKTEKYPLHKAAASGDADEVNRLLRGGAEIDKPNELGDRALHFSAAHNKIATARALVKAGANVHLPNKDDQTPWDVAVKAHHISSDIARFLREAMEKQGG